MSNRRSAFGAAAALIMLAAGGLAAGPASAAEPAKNSTPCFFVTQWQGWSSPSPTILYLGVNMHDVYRVDLAGGGSTQLQGPNMHLVSISRGGNSVCTALDLDLKIADSMGFSEPLIAKTLTKLTPEEVAAIPKKYRPN